MITVKIGDQEFVKTSDKWIDKKTKKPAPEGLIKILELAAAQMKNEEPKSDESPKSAGSSTSFKRETIEVKVLNKISLQLDRLGKSIEKLSAVILKNNEDSPAAPATKPPPVPSLMKAMGQTLKEKISGVKDQYGRVLTGGFLREAAGAISPNLASLYFGARDKQREAKAQLAEYEENQANLSTSAPKTGEQEEVETSIAKPSKYAAKEAVTENKETVKVELVEISNDVLEKLVRAIKTSSSSNDPLDKDDNTTSSDKKNPLGGIASVVAGGVGALAAGKKALGGSVAGNVVDTLDDLFVLGSIDDIVDHFCMARFPNTTTTAIAFQNETIVNSTIYYCNASIDDFNYSTNPTYTDLNGKIQVVDEVTDIPFSYITTVGLYNSSNELMAVAKLSRPIEKNPLHNLSIRVRLDY